MAANLFWLLVLIVSFSPSRALGITFRPISDSHRFAALELFVPIEGSYGSLEETYEALRAFQILGTEKNIDVKEPTCTSVMQSLQSSGSSLRDVYYALRLNKILGCYTDPTESLGVLTRLQAALKDASALEDIYYSVGSLLLIRDQGSIVILPESGAIIHSIKALSQSDGRWKYSLNGTESSIYAAGLAIEAFAGIVSLSDSEVDHSLIGVVKNDILKLFDGIRSYDDGSLYFDEKHTDTTEYKGPILTTSSVVRGVAAFAEVVPGRLNIPGEKILGLAKFFLIVGVPGNPRDFYNQLESLSHLDNNRIYIPLILSLPSSILSLSLKDQIKVEVTTVFGSASPPLSVNLVQALRFDSNGAAQLDNQELKFDQENGVHYLDIFPLQIDIGKYALVFKVALHAAEHKNVYAIEGQTKVIVFFNGHVKVENAEISVLSNDDGKTEITQKLDLSKDNEISLSANHLQKLRLSFQCTSPRGRNFKPHQVFLKLRHETKVEHIFLLESSAKQFKVVLDFLGLVERLYYLSGKYDIELAIGDSVMENSFLAAIGHIDLELPEPPEKAQRPPPVPVDPYSRFVPKPEISHIFRAPEKRPSKELSLAFLILTLFPLLGLVFGLVRLGANLKAFPSSTLPAAFTLLFHASIGAVLVLYVLFWLKLDLFTTLKALGLLGFLLVFFGHRALSYHASASSSKLKSS